MMKRLVLFSVFLLIVCTGFAQKATSKKYKVMLQMSAYAGEGAYVVLSLVDSKGVYEKTLYVMGPDKQWYNTLKEWDKFRTNKPTELSGITGASVTGGDRGICIIEIDNAKINQGYKIRFETAVEDNKYYRKDVEVPATTEGLSGRTEGTGGYISYVRISTL